MSRLASPLRYPGGKACLFDLAVQIISANGLNQHHYAEPYSGGCGLALSLLYDGRVSEIHLNDLDRSVWAFWYSVINLTDEFVERVRDVRITVSEWERQRQFQQIKESADILDLGFSTFFLNRTNRSGIIHSGGIIGGRKQIGSWKIDCRFNKSDLIKRIERVAKYGNRINIYNEDAEVFLDRMGGDIPSNTVVYIDPPYFEKGSKLYRNSYKPVDHQRIASKIRGMSNPWFMTYDNVEPIRNLYGELKTVDLDIGYSVQVKRRGSEILIASDEILLPFEAMASAH